MTSESTGTFLADTGDRTPPRALLRALGGLTLEPMPESHDGEAASRAMQELATRRRKLALLLYLASQNRAISRELLATMFWGEEAPERARHNLAEALSHIRRAFGRDAIATRVQEVALAAHCPIAFDVRHFDAAVDDGDPARASSLYPGPFLAGVFVDRAHGFDDWASRERARISARFVAVCRVRVPQLVREGRSGEAVSLAERWLDEDLEDADAALALLSAIASPGTRAALRDAMARYRQLQSRLQAEHGSEPDVRVTALSAAHEAALATLPARREADIGGAEASERVPVVAAAERVGEVAPEPVMAAVNGAVPPRRWFAKRVLGAALVVFGAAAWLLWRSAQSAPSTPSWVLVADTQDPARDPVTAASVTMALSVALAQGEQLNVVTRERIRDVLRLMRRPDSTFLDEATALEIATRIGAERIVVPSLARLGAQRALSARTIDVASGRTLGEDQTSAVNDDALLPALDLLSQHLRKRLGAAPRTAGEVRPLPDVTTASLGALREYTAANAQSGRRVYDSAIVSYRRAIALDSNFATAHAALGQLLYFTNQPSEGEASLARALALRARLSEREAMRNEALQARWRRLPDSAIAIQQRWLAAHPHDRDTRSSLAYDLFQGRQHAAARDIYLTLLTVDSLDARDWINLAAATSALDTDADQTLARRAFARAFALDASLRTDGIQNNEYGSLLVRAGFPDSAAHVFRLMLQGPPGQAARGYRSLGLLALWRGDARNAIGFFDSAATAHSSATNESLGEVRTRVMLAQALGDAGEAARARTELERVRVLSRVGVAEPAVLYWAGKAMVRRGMIDAAREMLDTLTRRAVAANVRHESASLLLRGELAVALGRGREALPLLERGVALDDTPVSRESLAYAARKTGATARADSLYGALAQSLRFGTEAMLAQQSAREALRLEKR